MRFISILLFQLLTITVAAQKTTLINNVQIFNGIDEKVMTGNILIVDNRIQRISSSPIPTNRSANTIIIDGKGKFLMPGMIDAHTHIMMESLSIPQLMGSSVEFIAAVGVRAAEKGLMQGFTTFRDLGGPAFGIKEAIDRGIIAGPRIYPSGAMISQTGGHGDFLLPQDVPRDAGAPLGTAERNNFGILADGVEEVTKRVREQLRLGATQIKLAAGGGAASNYDPLDVSQYSEAEIAAAVNAAENWNTYVTVHAYTPKGIQTALKAGVKCIEHGQLLDEETAKMIAEKKAWLSLQPFLSTDKSKYPPGSSSQQKIETVQRGTDIAYQFAKKYKINTAFGTDCLFDREKSDNRGKELTKLSQWYTPFEILRMCTAVNGQLMALCGPRNPYPYKLGVIEEGAYADLLLVEGNPLKDIKVLETPATNLLIIMKDGVIYKNILSK